MFDVVVVDVGVDVDVMVDVAGVDVIVYVGVFVGSGVIVMGIVGAISVSGRRQRRQRQIEEKTRS